MAADSSVNAAFEQLRRANPEPDLLLLQKQLRSSPTLDLEPIRRFKVDTQTIKPRPQMRKPRKWLPAIAAASMVVLTALLIFRVDPFRPQSDLEVANGYMDARNQWDASTARALLAPDAILNDSPIIGIDELELGFEALRVYGFQFKPYMCEEFGQLTRCTYSMTTELQRITGAAPVEGSFEFEIDGGRITALFHTFNYTDFGPNFDAFLVWLDNAHPGSFGQLFREEGALATPLLTREAVDLAATYLAEYDQFVNG